MSGCQQCSCTHLSISILTAHSTVVTRLANTWQDVENGLLSVANATYNSWARPRGAQLTAGYTVNTYSKPPLYYALGAGAPLLPCLRTAAVTARRIHSGLAALCRTRTDRRATDTTYQPANQPPTSQPDSSRFASTQL